jgi:hypothetical protein
VIGEEPTYLDAYLRQAYMARDSGSHIRAFEILDQAKKYGYTKPIY